MNYFPDFETRQAREIVPGVRARIFWADRMMMMRVDIDAGAVVPMHQHPAEQAGFVVNGRIKFTINGQSKWLKPGDGYLIPGDAPHMAEAADQPVQLVEFFSPVREELKD
ncbi:MAG: hypothetical protein Kow0080_29430 [Candidatus Promineifilaceae bacterium]